MDPKEKENFEALQKENEELKNKLAEADKKAKTMKPDNTFKMSKDASVSHSIEVESLEADTYHENGDKFLVGEKNAIKLAEAKKVKILGKFTDPELAKKAKSLGVISMILIAFMSLASLSAHAQLTAPASTNTIHMKTTLTSSVDSVVVTDTGSGSLYVNFTSKAAKSIQALFTKVSGTNAGTVTLYGSNDGVNWEALTDATSTPTITTYTRTDAGTYAVPISKTWHLGFHNMKAYRLTHVGTGTMVSRFKAIVYYE